MWETKTETLIDVGNGCARLSEIAAATIINKGDGVVTLTLKSGVQVRTSITATEFWERVKTAAR